MLFSLGYLSVAFPDLGLIVFYYRIKVPECSHPNFESLSHYEELDWSSVFFNVYFVVIYELTYLCLHMRLIELVSSIHFLCFQVLIQICNV